ncbi:F-box protein [Carex littledalei]|uniref:F-box protein n=1 Tax=Carex littledalei TaxID=544730 RepID=A0A833RB00_9POAL|nr:F-box protein [Carex littledalei]
MTVEVDRISNLPNGILAHILSFVSTKEAIHACILSKTWKYIWTAVPTLEFDFRKFCHDHRVLDGNIKEYEAKYVQFVEGVMLNREALLLDTFKLNWFNYDCHQYYTPKSVTEVIPRALKFKPRVLSVNFHLDNCENLDIDSIFNSDSLEDVHLSCNYDLKKFAPNSINLPHLKNLKLLRQGIGRDFLNKLFLECPVLEELTLCNCALNFDKIYFNILKKLIVVDCHRAKEVEKLEIITPSLLYLEIERCYGLTKVSASNMLSLVDASIEFGWYELDGVVIGGSEPNFLGSLSNVTSLHVIVECEIKTLLIICCNFHMMEKLKNGASNCPTFNNLKRLSILWRVDYNFDLIAFFLYNSPNLEDITLLDEIFSENASPNLGLEEPKYDLSRREHLETVTILNCCKISSETLDLLSNSVCEFRYLHINIGIYVFLLPIFI